MRTLVSALVVTLCLVPFPAMAQEVFPSRPVMVINPYPPGGQADLSGRPVVAALEKVLKQPVILANKPGAAGAVGMQTVAVAKPDGYTILITVPSLTTLPEVDKLFGRAPVFTREQFTPIARISADPCVLAVNADRPWKTIKELVDDARRRPGEVTFSSAGIYGATHVPVEMFAAAAGPLKLRHLPTAGGGPAVTAVLGGHADLLCSTIGPATPHLKAGKLRALAVTSTTRHVYLPDVPTLKEQGFDVDYAIWIGLFAPKATPPAVVKTLREAVRHATEDATLRASLDKVQAPLAYQDADDFQKFWDAEAVRLAEAIRKIGKLEAK